MKKLDIAVIEDNDIDRENCLSFLNRYANEKGYVFTIDPYQNGESFLFNEKNYHILIVDINLGGINGIELTRKIREKDNLVIIIFVTNLAKYACSGYEVDAMDFLIKPLKYLQFSLKIDKAVSIAEKTFLNEIIIASENGVTKVNVNDILYIEVQGHVLRYHINNEILISSGSLKECEKKLGQYGFLKCNNCYLVNAYRISRIKKYDCYLDTGESILISHPRRKAFMDDFMEYIGKEGM